MRNFLEHAGLLGALLEFLLILIALELIGRLEHRWRRRKASRK